MSVGPIPKPCGVCGRRVEDGRGRCAAHRGRAYRLPVSCKVCGKLGPASFCAAHKPAPFGNDRTEAERLAAQPWRIGYRDPAYHREKAAALRRAAGKCEKCARADLPLEVDHQVPLSTATNLDEVRALNVRTNLLVLCQVCHRAKTAADRRKRNRGA